MRDNIECWKKEYISTGLFFSELFMMTKEQSSSRGEWMIFASALKHTL